MHIPYQQEAAECGDQSFFALERVMYLRNVLAASVSGIVCLGASISAASAQGYNWTGFSFYGGVGGQILDGDVSVNDKTRYGYKQECEYTSSGTPTALLCIDIPLLSV